MNRERFSKSRLLINGQPCKRTSRDLIRQIHDTKRRRESIMERRALAEDDDSRSALEKRLKRNKELLEYLQDYLLYVLKGEIDRIPFAHEDKGDRPFEP